MFNLKNSLNLDLINLGNLILKYKNKLGINEVLLLILMAKKIKNKENFENNILTFDYNEMLNALDIQKATYHKCLNNLEKLKLIVIFRGTNKKTKVYINFEVL